jgi:hypothetical protein
MCATGLYRYTEMESAGKRSKSPLFSPKFHTIPMLAQVLAFAEK